MMASKVLMKKALGIIKSNSVRRGCKHCHYYNANLICSKHFIKVKLDETCNQFNTEKFKTRIVGGGGVSPK